MGQKSHQLSVILKLRASEPDRRAFQDAAVLTKQTVSAWMRAVLLERIAELRGRKVLP
jgi:hypothetical protein